MRRDRRRFRAVTIGDSGVGKTSIVGRFIRNVYDPSEPATAGGSYDSFTGFHQGACVEVELWDTAGQEEYRSLAPIYFRNAAAALLVFDLTSRDSFDHLDEWLAAFRAVAGAAALAIVVGNKTDREDRVVAADEARGWALRNSGTYCETSAANGNGIEELFQRLTEALAGTVAEPQAQPAARQAQQAATPRECC